MLLMFPVLELENHGFDGNIKSTVRLYLRFYESLGLNSKMEELRTIYYSLKSLKVTPS